MAFGQPRAAAVATVTVVAAAGSTNIFVVATEKNCETLHLPCEHIRKVAKHSVSKSHKKVSFARLQGKQAMLHI